MENNIDNFLAAEQAVAELLGNLEALKSEIQGYAEASANFEEARKGLTSCAGQLNKLAKSAEPIIKALSTIGTPEILMRIEELGAANQELVAQHERAVAAIREAIGVMEASNQKLAKKLEGLTAGAAGSIERVAQSIESIVAAVPKRASEVITPKIKADIIAAQEALEKKMTSLITINAALLVLATLVVIFVLKR